MKSTIISMFIVLILMIALPILFLGENNVADRFGFGFGFDDFGSTADAPVKLLDDVKAVTTKTKVEVYTWVDESGVKHFSQTPHSEGQISEKMVLKPNTNIMDAQKVPEEEVEVAAGPKVFKVGNPYTPGGMKEVADGAKDFKDDMGQREMERENMMKELFPGLNNQKK